MEGISIVSEDSFRSDETAKDKPCDMMRVTLEMPVTYWRTMRGSIGNSSIICHSRRSSDFKKESGVKCIKCESDRIILRGKEGCLLTYKCGVCNEEFLTDILREENERRKEKSDEFILGERK